MRWLFVLLFLSVLPAVAFSGAAWAEDRPRAGLIWNRSGLPATFPLIVKSRPGDDYALFVTDPEDGAEVMAGYVRGGEFFRLLLPPGEWRLRFAHGREWQGEDDLFGAETEWIEVPRPLDFRLLGVDRRRAYVVTLGERDGAVAVTDARAGVECQLVLWDSENREWPEDMPATGPATGPATRPGDVDLLDREGTDDPRRSDRHRSRLHDPDPYPDRPDLRYRDRERPRLRYLDREFGLYTRLCG